MTIVIAIRSKWGGEDRLVMREFSDREEAIAEFAIEAAILQEEGVSFWGTIAGAGDTKKREKYVRSIPAKVSFEEFADVARKLFPGCVPEDETCFDCSCFVAYKGDGAQNYVLRYQEDYGDTIWGDGYRRAGLSLAECLY